MSPVMVYKAIMDPGVPPDELGEVGALPLGIFVGEACPEEFLAVSVPIRYVLYEGAFAAMELLTSIPLTEGVQNQHHGYSLRRLTDDSFSSVPL